jgi:pre-mRNA 3'-end-processing factor FIP1
MRMQNFSGMPEDQLTQLPPDIRTMVMTGATAMTANGGDAAWHEFHDRT